MATSLKRKMLSPQATVGQQGINLIESIVLAMGCRWSATGPLDTGIDGYIELFDPNTHESLGAQLSVQSKAVELEFENETVSSLSYRCERRDLDYWRSQNMPVLLIVSRPSTSEAYWVRVNGRADQANSLTFHFDKKRDRLSPDSLRELLKEGAAPDAGISLGAEVKREKLISNFLPIAKLPKKVFVASTDCRHPKQIWDAFRASGERGGKHWVLRGHQLVGFHDFSARAWRNVCDPGSVEEFDVEEWAASDAPDRVSDFRQLLHRAVDEKLYPEKVKFRRDLDCFYFLASSDGTARTLPYRSVTRDSAVTVFNTYSRTTPDGRIFAHHRHLAFEPKFREYGGTHYLEITPTYLFTSDGQRLDRFHASRLSGIKRMEGNRAVLSNVMIWADLLSRPADLLSLERPLVEFGSLATFELNVGIDDRAWKPRKEDEEVLREGGNQAAEDEGSEEFDFES